MIVGDYSDVKFTKELSEQEQAAKKKDEAKMEKLAEKIKALGNEEDVAEEREALTKKLFARDEAMNKKYFGEARRASYIWLYLRQPVDATGSTNGADAPRSDGERIVVGGAAKEDGSAKTKKSGPIEFTTRLESDESDSGQCTLIVEATIKDGWKLPAVDDSDQASTPVSFKLSLPDGWKAEGEWKKPDGELCEKSGEKYLKESAIWKRSIDLPANGSTAELVVEISFQVCNDQLGLPPKSVKKTVLLDKK